MALSAHADSPRLQRVLCVIRKIKCSSVLENIQAMPRDILNVTICGHVAMQHFWAIRREGWGRGQRDCSIWSAGSIQPGTAAQGGKPLSLIDDIITGGIKTHSWGDMGGKCQAHVACVGVGNPTAAAAALPRKHHAGVCAESKTGQGIDGAEKDQVGACMLICSADQRISAPCILVIVITFIQKRHAWADSPMH